MKRFLFAAVLVTITAPALAADVGVSISLGQPGFYGQIDIGNYPAPQLIYRAPVIVQPVPMGMAAQPMYLRVPPGHRKNWRKHCQRYNACGQQVYFVRNDWYNNVYVPSYRSHGNFQGNGRGDNDRNYYRNDGGGHHYDRNDGGNGRNYDRNDGGNDRNDGGNDRNYDRNDGGNDRSHGGHGKNNGGGHNNRD